MRTEQWVGMTNDERIELVRERAVAHLWLNRPDRRNAFDERMIAALDQALNAAIADPDVRCIVLAGRGRAFCAGGDLEWMRRARRFTAQEAHEDSLRLARLLRRIHDSPKPVVARIHGACFAGGLGLAAAAHIALASANARFCLSEVRLGLVPAIISPYVIAAIGARQARRHFLTAEVFDAAEARRIGLVHEVVPEHQLDDMLDSFAKRLGAAGPNALREAGRLIDAVTGRPIDDALLDETAAWITRLRTSDEAREGISAFFEKRAPRWTNDDGAGA